MVGDLDKVREIAEQVRAVMLASHHTRQVNTDWGQRQPTVHFVLDQDRLRAIGLSSTDAAEQLHFLLTRVDVTQVREDIRSVEVTARSAGAERLDPARICSFVLTGTAGQRVPLDQIGRIESCNPASRTAALAAVGVRYPQNLIEALPARFIHRPQLFAEIVISVAMWLTACPV